MSLLDRCYGVDFAVAAPFLLVGSSESESGVVYIFRGARDGLRSKDPSQVSLCPLKQLLTSELCKC